MTRTSRFALGAGSALFALSLCWVSADGARAQACMSDDDCADGYACDLGPVAMQDCPNPSDAGACDSTPQPRSGECEPRKMTCDVDADCVTGLTCEHRGGDCTAASPAPGAAVDAGAADEACEPSPGECVYEFVPCEQDSDCDDGLECAPISKTSNCSSAPSNSCMPGQACPVQPQEENCTETVHSYCFPPRVDCENDGDCDDGARCVELNDDAKKDPPPGWVGATALCFPEALALAVEGRVEVSGGESSSDESASSDSKSNARAPADDTGAKQLEAGKDQVKSDCSVSALGAGAFSHASLLVFSAVALCLRRRRAR